MAGQREAAAERFGDLVAVWQRRALRLAYHYLGNAADADDAVQDAFVKVFGHMTSYRADLPFDAWFTRILVNACLDRAKARTRARRWLLAGRRRRAPLAAVEHGRRRRSVARTPAAGRREVAGAGGRGPAPARPASARSSCSAISTNRPPRTSRPRSA